MILFLFRLRFDVSYAVNGVLTLIEIILLFRYPIKDVNREVLAFSNFAFSKNWIEFGRLEPISPTHFRQNLVHLKLVFVCICRISALSFILSLFLHCSKLGWISIFRWRFLNVYDILKNRHFLILICLNYVFVNLILPSSTILTALNTSDFVFVFRLIKRIGSRVDWHSL